MTMLVQCRDLDVAWVAWGRGEPLLLVHGLADDHRAWLKVLPWRALDHRVIAYDLRGHGQTSAGTPEGGLAQLGADLIAFLDALEIDRAHLCGFSLGGTIVMRAAIDPPERGGRLLPLGPPRPVGPTRPGV